MATAPSVLNHPAAHPYLDHLTAVNPRPVDVEYSLWDVPSLVRAGVGLVHLHFGFEDISPDALRAWCRGVQHHGIALVHTVHDLDNPHLVDQSDHHERLDILIENADALFTLTDAANSHLVARWGRNATVVPHPHVAPFESIASTVPAATDSVLVWLGAMRSNLDLDAVHHLIGDCTSPLDVVVRSDGWKQTSQVVRRDLLAAISGADSATLAVIERPDDRELCALVAQRRALVLPYRWGTHSGLVELAKDLGVASVVPSVGCHVDQGATVAPADQLAAAVSAARCSSVTPRSRRDDIEASQRIHADVYRCLLGTTAVAA